MPRLVSGNTTQRYESLDVLLLVSTVLFFCPLLGATGLYGHDVRGFAEPSHRRAQHCPR